MEVIEDGNIMDRIPILLQRDLEYYQVYLTYSYSFYKSILFCGMGKVPGFICVYNYSTGFEITVI